MFLVKHNQLSFRSYWSTELSDILVIHTATFLIYRFDFDSLFVRIVIGAVNSSPCT